MQSMFFLLNICPFHEQMFQILVDDRLFFRCHPAAALPIDDPGGNAVLHVVGVGDNLDLARLFQGREALNGGGEFHAIVGRVGLRAVLFFNEILVSEDAGPAALAGVAEAGAVSDELDFLEFAH